MRLALMVEGQEGVTWEDWRALAATGERLGPHPLFRSDNYMWGGGRAERGSV